MSRVIAMFRMDWMEVNVVRNNKYNCSAYELFYDESKELFNGTIADCLSYCAALCLEYYKGESFVGEFAIAKYPGMQEESLEMAETGRVEYCGVDGFVEYEGGMKEMLDLFNNEIIRYWDMEE